MKKANKTTSYRILAVVFIMVAAGLVLLPKSENHPGISPDKLLANAMSSERYISTDELAEMIIGRDPSFILIDLRNGADYSKYAIPGAVHIPLDSILSDGYANYFDQEQYDIVFYSNDDFIADQAWMLFNRLDYTNHKVLQGGINAWYNTIIRPVEPTEDMPATAFETYEFRKAASMYFGVAYPGKVIKAEPKPAPKQVVPVKKKKKMPTEGGC